MSSTNQTIVLSDAQMEALADPLRSDMVLALRGFGRASVAELALRIAADAKSLYYPLRKLVAVGLVCRVGTQQGKRRSEAVYALVADHLEISPTAPLEMRAKLVKTTLRAAEKEFLAAQALPDLATQLSITRSQLWLTDADASLFRRRLNELEAEFSNRSEVGRGTLLHWTSLVAPAGPA